ncbi:MAG: hypothetical protein WC450_03345 [Candidatus Omnitrophota bacterium]|jgi:V/A-type H+-transporting ATPase subunit I
MIVPMKKVLLLVPDKDLEPALLRLRDMGVLHVEHLRVPAGENLNKLKDDVKFLEQVILSLTHEHKNPDQVAAADWEETADVILGLAALRDGDREGIVKRQGQIEQWEPWGDFSLEDIAQLRAKGLKVELAEVPEKEVPAAPAGIILEPIFIKHKIARCLAVSCQDVDIPYKILPLPYQRLSRLKEEQQWLRKRMKKSHQQLLDDSKYLDYFKKLLAEKKEQHAFISVKEGSASQAAISYVKGFCPADLISRLEAAAQEGHWGLFFEDPSDDDRVPTLLRYPEWVKMIKPLFAMTQIVPGYREVDISPFFLVFFSVFVGILIGDAGYGAVTLLGLIIFYFKMKKENRLTPEIKTAVQLGFLLSGCVILWGVLSGTYFGQGWLGDRVNPLVPWVNNERNFQLLCFLIGAVHITIAHAWRLLQRLPSLTAVVEAGWILIVWAMFFIARMLILAYPLPAAAKFLLGTGIFLVLFFTKPQRNLIKAGLAGLGNLALNIVNSFTDVVSYIRLYAVGLASVAVADAANAMPLIGMVGLHVINFALALLALMVHGVRLNTLEFSGHLGLEWAGFAYEPFKKTKS